MEGKITPKEHYERSKARALGGLAGLAALVLWKVAPAVIAVAARNPEKVVPVGQFVLGVVDPHPPGASPLDTPGPIDDAGRVTKQVVKEGVERLTKKAEQTVVAKVEKKAVQQIEKKVEQKVAGQAEKAAGKEVGEKAVQKAGALKFGDDDLVYGPSAGGKLRNLQKQAGGKLLNDLEKPVEKTFTQFSLDTLDSAAAAGRKVHFDLTNVKDLPGALAGTGKFGGPDIVTGQELRHLAKNWEKFKDVVTFYRDGKVVSPPWAK